MDRERRALFGMHDDANRAVFRIIAFHIDAHGCSGQAIANRAGRIAHRAKPVVAGNHPLRMQETLPCRQKRAERVAVLQREQTGCVAAEREACRVGEHRLVRLLNRLNTASVRRECRVNGVVHQRFELIRAEFAARAGQQRFKRRRQFAGADRAHAAAGMRARQQRIGGHAAACRAVRLVHAGKTGFRRGEMLARTGQHAAKRACPQTFAQVCAVCTAQKVMRIAGFILMSERVEQLVRREGTGNRRAVGEGVIQGGIIRPLTDEHHQHGKNRLLSGDVVEQDAGFQRVGGVHGVLGREGAHAQGVMQIFHVAEHEGQQLLVAAHGIGGGKRTEHASAGGKGFALRAERTVLALTFDYAAAQGERLTAKLFVAQLGGGQQHGFKNIGRVHAAAQCAAEPDALLAGFREQGSTTGEQPAAQGEQTVAHRAAGRDRADGQSGETTRRKRRAGKERASQHDDYPPI